MNDNIVDIATRKPISPDMPQDVTLSRWFDIWKKYSKNAKVRTVMLVGIGEDGEVYSDIYGEDEVALLKLYRECDNLKYYIDEILSPEIELDEDEE